MQSTIKIIILTIVLFSSSSSFADGNELLKKCAEAESFLNADDDGDSMSFGFCVGFVHGVSSIMKVMENEGSIKVCFPKGGITNGQSMGIVLEYLRKNPTELHERDVFLTMKAFLDAFPYPCV
jgi:hypothetical protein